MKVFKININLVGEIKVKFFLVTFQLKHNFSMSKVFHSFHLKYFLIYSYKLQQTIFK